MIAADDLHEEGVRRLACAVLEKAVSDYRAFKASKKKHIRKPASDFCVLRRWGCWKNSFLQRAGLDITWN